MPKQNQTSPSDLGNTYDTIIRPGWAPPKWVFGVVWTLIYILYIVAGALGLGNTTREAVWLYVAGWVVNVFWLLIFQNRRVTSLLSAVTIVILLLIIASLCGVWYREGQFVLASMLLPYVAWLTIAAALNFHIWVLNRKN